MNPLASLKEECQQLLWDALESVNPGAELPESKYSYPPNPEMGDISSAVCFQLARSLKQRPADIAERMVEAIKVENSPLIGDVRALNGYINFNVEPSRFAELVLNAASYEDYGFLETDEPEIVMVEHTSANPNAPLHIGNARNAIIGDSLANLLESRGHKVLRHFLVNDMGRQVAMTTFGWKLLDKPEPQGRAEDWVGAIYASANVVNELKRVRAELAEAEKDGRVMEIAELQEELEKFEIASRDLRRKYPQVYDTMEEKMPLLENPESFIAQYNTAYENNEPDTVEEIRKIVGYCLYGFETSLGEIGIGFDSFDFESDLVWAKTADTVLKDLEKTPYVFKDNGVLILDCNKIATELNLKERWGLHPRHEIPNLVLVRSDGTTLYTLRDIAYSLWKFQKAERVINVIGTEQLLAQLQLRLALAALGHIWMGDKQMHYPYEHVRLPDVKMSGRLGRYVTLMEVIEKSVDLATQEVELRAPHLSKEEKENIAKMVGYGAVKYTILSVDARKMVTFDWKKALNFEVNSAPFIQYSHARACNILKRVDEIDEPDYGLLTHVKERELIMTLAKFPGVFEGAVDELKPGDITAYANLLADKFNSFYAAVPVLKAENEKLKNARLMLVDAVRVTILNALHVLGIKAPERM
jgi:arginyl-tRNA synthetase